MGLLATMASFSITTSFLPLNPQQFEGLKQVVGLSRDLSPLYIVQPISNLHMQDAIR